MIAELPVTVADNDRRMIQMQGNIVWSATAVLKWVRQSSGNVETIPILACALYCPGSSMTNQSFRDDHVDYTIGGVTAIRDIRPGNHNWSRFRLSIRGQDPVTHQSIGLTDQQVQSWTLYINDDIQLALSSAADSFGGGDFVWFG